ncbi:rhodopsin-like [Actinia tenebrosa]|uniref:Rhodopsin-like n=1 Tax=Actinia tenebrosa TaxID=6105 RepID=A0A6P8I6F5_ACTTE|nr:rhodopsin-like [Actinia tenebrosa]XP_031563543.1 rhodopsin-like [Actinia tenebrosa]XP_031563550.1 rhodopsin-like [Actinia tenebrosa]
MVDRFTTNNSSSVFALTGKTEVEVTDCDGKWVYGGFMFFVLSVGILGNVLTIIVFLQREQRSKAIAPFVINLAVADLFIVVFGYPVAITANLSCRKITTGQSRCTWSAFVNGAIGIASIVMLTEISVLICYNITSMKPHLYRSEFTSKTFKTLALSGAWIYGILSMSPPLLGWSRFVPGSAGISCGPEWGSNTFEALTYNIALLIVGFFLPMTIILISYYKIYSSLTLNAMLAQQKALLQRRRHSKLKVARMIGIVVLAFVVSWSPYCIVSIVAIFKSTNILSKGEAEIPELMAKASVIYNPLVYASMSSGFKKTVKRLLRDWPCHRVDKRDSQASPDKDMITTKLQIIRLGNLSSRESINYV